MRHITNYHDYRSKSIMNKYLSYNSFICFSAIKLVLENDAADRYVCTLGNTTPGFTVPSRTSSYGFIVNKSLSLACKNSQ